MPGRVQPPPPTKGKKRGHGWSPSVGGGRGALERCRSIQHQQLFLPNAQSTHMGFSNQTIMQRLILHKMHKNWALFLVSTKPEGQVAFCFTYRFEILHQSMLLSPDRAGPWGPQKRTTGFPLSVSGTTLPSWLRDFLKQFPPLHQQQRGVVHPWHACHPSPSIVHSRHC